jgi:hypothetical protein
VPGLEIVEHLGDALVPVRGIALQRPRHDVRDPRRELGPDLPHRLRLLVEPLHHHGQRVPADERELPREHHVEDHAERVQVPARIRLLAASLLGRHLVHGADHAYRLGDRSA